MIHIWLSKSEPPPEYRSTENLSAAQGLQIQTMDPATAASGIDGWQEVFGVTSVVSKCEGESVSDDKQDLVSF